MWEKAQVAQEHKQVTSAPWFTNLRHVQLHKNKRGVFLYKFLSSFVLIFLTKMKTKLFADLICN